LTLLFFRLQFSAAKIGVSCALDNRIAKFDNNFRPRFGLANGLNGFSFCLQRLELGFLAKAIE